MNTRKDAGATTVMALAMGDIKDKINSRNEKVVPIVPAKFDSEKLPDIDLQMDFSIDEEEVEKAAQEIAKKREWATKAGERLFECHQSLKVLYSKFPDWDLDESLSKQGAKIQNAIKEIEGVKDKALWQLVKCYEFLSEIRAVKTKEDMNGIVHKLTTELACNHGETPRYREVFREEIHRVKSENKGKLSEGAFLWEDKVYFPNKECFFGIKTPEEEALYLEISKKIKEFSFKKREKIVRKTQELMSRKDASDDLTSVVLGKEGCYKLHLQPKTEGKRTVRHGGAIIVQVFIREMGEDRRPIAFLKPVDYSGVFSFLDNYKGKWHVSLMQAIYGKLPENFPKEHYDEAKKFVFLLNELLFSVHRKITGCSKN